MGNVRLDDGSLVPDPVFGALLVRGDGALGETTDVAVQHVQLVVVSNVFLEGKSLINLVKFYKVTQHSFLTTVIMYTNVTYK